MGCLQALYIIHIDQISLRNERNTNIIRGYIDYACIAEDVNELNAASSLIPIYINRESGCNLSSSPMAQYELFQPLQDIQRSHFCN